MQAPIFRRPEDQGWTDLREVSGGEGRVREPRGVRPEKSDESGLGRGGAGE